MIIYAFSTLGKTYITSKHPGQYWDLAVNRFSKQLGYSSGYVPEVAKQLANVVVDAERNFKAIFISIIDNQIMANLASHGLMIVLPRYGVQEFRSRLFIRYGAEYVNSDEWKSLGHCYAQRIHQIESEAKRLKVPIKYVNHLSDAFV